MYTNIVNTPMGIPIFFSRLTLYLLSVATYGRRRVKATAMFAPNITKDENPIELTTCPTTSVLSAAHLGSIPRPFCLFTNWLYEGRWFLLQTGSTVDIHDIRLIADQTFERIPSLKSLRSNLFLGVCFCRIVLYKRTSVTFCLINDFSIKKKEWWILKLNKKM